MLDPWEGCGVGGGQWGPGAVARAPRVSPPLSPAFPSPLRTPLTPSLLPQSRASSLTLRGSWTLSVSSPQPRTAARPRGRLPLSHPHPFLCPQEGKRCHQPPASKPGTHLSPLSPALSSDLTPMRVCTHPFPPPLPTPWQASLPSPVQSLESAPYPLPRERLITRPSLAPHSPRRSPSPSKAEASRPALLSSSLCTGCSTCWERLSRHRQRQVSTHPSRLSFHMLPSGELPHFPFPQELSPPVSLRCPVGRLGKQSLDILTLPQHHSCQKAEESGLALVRRGYRRT